MDPGAFFSRGHGPHGFRRVLNFPRRIATTYLNAALHNLHKNFSEALASNLDEKGISAPRYLLKPDGGTIDLASSGSVPARNAQSGPAASVMGALALDGCEGADACAGCGRNHNGHVRGTERGAALQPPMVSPLGLIKR